MANPIFRNINLPIPTLVILFSMMPIFTSAFMPYTTRSNIWDIMVPTEEPFRIVEQTPLTIPKGVESLALARADWKETPKFHIITLDIPGIKKDDVKIEVEENRVLKISGERKAIEDEIEGERWHRAERTNGKFWRQFRLPNNADLDHVNAHLQDGVLKIFVPKFAEEQRRQPKVINIVDQGSSSGQDIKPTKADA